MANTIAMFDSFKRALMAGSEHMSKTFHVGIMSAGWTPDMNTSTVASLTSKMVALVGGNSRQCPGVGQVVANITVSAAGRVRFDLSDLAVTASVGNMSARYGCGWRSATDGQLNAVVPCFYWEISTTEIVANILNIQWPSGGIFKTDDNV